MRTQLTTPKGFSLVELVLYASIASFLGMIAANLISKPAHVVQFMAMTDAQQPGLQAAAQIESDLRMADPSSFPWIFLPPNSVVGVSSVTFEQVSYPMLIPVPAYTQITYSYQPGGSGQGSLVRQITSAAGSTTTVVLQNLDPPDAVNYPLCQQVQAGASSLSEVMVSLLYHPSNQPQFKIIKTISIRQPGS